MLNSACRHQRALSAARACVLFVSASALVSTAAYAGCNSGDTATDALLSSHECRADASSTVGATAVGFDAKATGPSAIAYGGSSRATADSTIAIGFNSHAEAPRAIAIGTHPDAIAADAISIGVAAKTTASAIGTISIGSFANNGVGAAFAVAIGTNTKASNTNAVAIGASDAAATAAQAKGYRSIAIGQTSIAAADFGTSVGYNTNTAFASTAIGTDATASGGSSSALGRFSKASGANATAAGVGSQAAGINSLALGASSNASMTGAVALGRGATASKVNAVALGNGSVADVGNTVSVGSSGHERRILNVAAGIRDTDAVNLAQVRSLIAAHAPVTASASAGAGVEPSPAPVVAAVTLTRGSAVVPARAEDGDSAAASTTPASSEQAHHSGCADGDIGGNWSLFATNIEEVGAGSVLWCDLNLAKAANATRYHVSGQCRGHAPHETAPQSYELSGNQSIAVDSACRFAGSFTIRQGQAAFTATILEGRIEGVGAVKSRAVAVARWPRGNRYALQTMVMQR